MKDAAVIANCPDREVRRQWVQRILDHDGQGDDPGGIEAWIVSARPPACARGDRRPAPSDTRRALCGRCLRQFRAPAPLAGSGLRLADRIVRAEDPPGTAGHLAGTLSLDRAGGLHYFRSRVQQARRDVEHGLRSRSTISPPARSSSARWTSCSSSSISCGRCSTACRSSTDSDMNVPEPSADPPASTPRHRSAGASLASGGISVCSGRRSRTAWVLLYPEGMVKLNPSAGEILKRCDGERTSEIIAELEASSRPPTCATT